MNVRPTESERARAGAGPEGKPEGVAPLERPAGEAPAAAVADAALAWRVLGFAALLALADLWLHHHFGYGIRNIGIPVGLAAALGLGSKAAGFLFGADRVKASLDGVVGRVKAVLRRTVTPPVLAGSAVVLGTAMLTVSSITIVSEDQSGGTFLQVTPLDQPRAGKPRPVSAGVTTVPVWTTPFGRLFRIDASGYVGSEFTVYPPVGLRLRLGRDLAALPAVLFRPAPETLGFIADGAVLTVLRSGLQGVDTIAADTGHSGSFLLGRTGAIGAALVADWERELLVGDSTGSMAGVHGTILLWKKPRALAYDATRLRVGDTLRVEVRLGDALVGRGEVVLEGTELIDVALEEVRGSWSP